MICPWVGGFPERRSDAPFGVLIQPSNIVLNVGEKTQVNVSITNPQKVSGGRVCFGLEGFPTSGFRTSFTKACSDSQQGGFGTILNVEVTPAAAPQIVTANVTASDGSQTAYAILTITVEPAFPVWIPWLGLVLFVSFLAVAIFWSPKSRKKNTGRTGRKQTKR
jgi:hypothetical protein